jgi:hypothetical protein
MEETTRPIHHSEKPVKKLEDVSGNQKYILPLELQNECDPVTTKRAVMVSINAKRVFIPVGEPTEISQDAFSLLKDVGIMVEKYQIRGQFDPLCTLTL